MNLRFAGLAVFGAYLAHVMGYNFLNDDAYISFRYALNLAEHGELTYNLGERVEGYTNFLWTILMSGVLYLGGDVAVWSRLLGVCFGAATLVAIGYFFHRNDHGLKSMLIAGGLLAAAPAFACWSTGGLETMMFTFFLTIGWLTLLSESDDTKTLRSPIYFAIAAMVRPEGILAFGLSMLLLGGRWLGTTRNGDGFKRIAYGCAWFLIIYGPYFGWRVWYYGWLFPNTYYVKTGAVGMWSPGLSYVWDWVLTHGLFVLPLCFALPLWKDKAQDRWLKACTALFLLVFATHVAKVGGDFMGLHRFLVPIMPICAVSLTLAVLAVLRRPFAKRVPAWSGWIFAIVCVYSAAGYAHSVNQKAMTVGSENGVDSIGWLKMFASQCRTIGEWMAETAPENSSIATTAAGTIPFYSRLYTVDILGLNDEWIAHEVPAQGNRPGHTRAAPESYLASKSVDYLLYHPQVMETPRRASGRQLRDGKGDHVRYTWTVERIPNLKSDESKPAYFGFWRKVEP